MSFCNLTKALVENPLSISLYAEQNQEGVITPGNPKFIITENEKIITTENSQLLITEN